MKKSFVLFLSALLGLSLMKAQITPGINCSVSVAFVPSISPVSFFQSFNEGWLNFTATSTDISLQLDNISNGNTSGKIIKATVFNGSCGSLTQLISDSIIVNTDTTLNLTLNNLIVGNSYWIKLDKNIFQGLCQQINNCSENSLFQIEIAPLWCGFSWGLNPVAPVGNPNPFGSATFNGFQYGCMGWNGPYNNAPPITYPNNVCEVNICTNTLYVGYSPANSYYGGWILQDYTLYVFPNVPNSTYSLAVSFTAGLVFNTPNATQYIIVPVTACSPPVTNFLTPQDLDGCGCYSNKKLIVNVAPPPSCNFTIPNPLCANQPFCFGNITNPSPPYITTWNIPGNLGAVQPNGCVPSGLPSGTYQVSYNAFFLTPEGGPNEGCKCSKTLTFTVGPEATPLTLQSSVEETCTGGNVYLQVNFPPIPNTGFTWQPGNIIGNPILVNPINSTTYTAYTSNGGCLFSGTIAIDVFTVLPAFSASLSTEFVCQPNNSSTLTMSPAGNYTIYYSGNLSGLPFNTSLVLNPNTSTTYTIVGQNPDGCLANLVKKINVVPCSCLAAPGNTLGNQQYYGLNLTPNVGFKAVSDFTIVGSNMGPCFFNQNDITVYPGVKITFLTSLGASTLNIVGTHFHGCGELWEGIEVRESPSCVNIIPGTTKTSMIEDARIAVNVLNVPLPWWPFFPIAYYNPTILNCDNVTFNKNIIGIKISNIQINQSNYPFSIKKCLFTSRNIPYTINNWPTTNTIKNSVNVGYNPVQTPYINNSLYPPTPIISNLYSYYGFPDEGIELRDVGISLQPSGYIFRGISIGQNGVPNFNCFDHLHTDIFAYNSNFSVINSVFQNGETFGSKKGNQMGGAAIVAYSNLSSTGTNRNSLQVSAGGGNGNFNCRFYEKTGCVDATDYFDVQISDAQVYSLGNNYNQFYQGNTFGERGFNIVTNRYQNIIFQRNKLYNIKNAMMIGINNLYSGPNILREIGQILVQDNTVDRSPTPALYGTAPYVNIGLSISDPAAATSLTVQGSLGAGVLTNYFNRVNNGISIMNLNPTPLGVLTNTVNLANEYPFFPVPTPTQVGISVRNCKKQVSIHSNRINGPNAVIGIPSWSSEMRALTTAFNSSLSVRCNTTQNTERGVEFNGTQTMDYFEDNWMSNESYGLVLDNGAILTSPINFFANTLGNPQRPTNNVWSHPWPVPGGFKTLTTGGSTAQNAKLYITWQPGGGNVDPDDSRFSTNGAAPPNQAYYFHNEPGNVTLPQSNLISPPAIGCRLGGGNGNGGGGNQNLSVGVLEQIAGPGFMYANNQSQHNAINRTFAYQTLVSDPALVAASPSITSFYNSAQFTSLQTMVDIEQNLVSGNIGAAQNLITNFTPTNTVELNYKNYYQIFKNVKDSDIVATDSIALFNLANMCPYTDGAVVYQARALYNIIFTGYHRFVDNCGPVQNAKIAPSSNNPEKLAAEPAINVILKTALYPNPNNGSFVLKLHEDLDVQTFGVDVFDIHGKLVLSENSTDSKETRFDMSNKLINGTYMVKVKLQDGSFDIHRLIISK